MNCCMCGSDKVLPAGYGITLIDCKGNSKDMSDVTATMPICQDCFNTAAEKLQAAVAEINFEDGGITLEF